MSHKYKKYIQELEKFNYQLKLCCYLLCFLLIILMIMNFLLIFPKGNNYNLTKFNGDLTDKQIQKTNFWVSNIKPEYLQLVKSVSFTNKNWSDKNVGQNTNGDIKILLTGDDCYDFGTLKHEIMHSLERPDLTKDLREFFAYDVEKSNLMEINRIC